MRKIILLVVALTVTGCASQRQFDHSPPSPMVAPESKVELKQRKFREKAKGCWVVTSLAVVVSMVVLVIPTK